jgi:adenosylhomocysteine nucleosidase
VKASDETRHAASGLVCFALEEEARPFRRLVADSAKIGILVTGIGAKNAEAAVRAALAETKPAFVLTCGYAGALAPKLHIGEVVFATDDPLLNQRLLAAGARPAVFHCAERVIPTAAEKQALRQTSGADAVEMESEPIRRLCHERGIPSATVRVISDTADEDLPLDFNRLMTENQRLSPAKVAAAVMQSPRKIPALLHLQKQTRLAGRQLAQALVKVVRG